MIRLRAPLILYAPIFATGLVLAVLLASTARAAPDGAIERVERVAITVSDMDRALGFYTGVLPFERVAETEVAGDAYERLFGVFGLRARIARLRLGEQEIELIDYLAPEGRPVPVDSKSNDEWFQHIAIIVRDMDQAYALLRRHNVQHASSGPQTLPEWNPDAGGSKPSTSRTPTAITWRSCSSHPAGGRPGGTRRATSCSSASTTPRSWCATPCPSAASSRARSASRSMAARRTTGSSRSA
jgi:catechol 2,3-dioxygenase-like lactoylglutathione lyase family enzyme